MQAAFGGWTFDLQTGRGQTIFRLLLISLCMLVPAAAVAQDSDSKWITVSPRVWLAQAQTQDTPTFFKETYFVPSFGASVSITPPMTKGLSLLLVGLYGTGGGDAIFAPTGSAVPLDVDVERFDLEGLLVFQFPTFPVNIFIGSRYIRLNEHLSGNNATTSVDFEIDSKIVIVKAGLGASGGLGEGGNHRLFGNVSAGVGFAENTTRLRIGPFLDARGESKATSPSLDVNVGYDYSISSRLGLQLRYRVSMVFLKDFTDQPFTDLTHGPELSMRFSL